jgi:hypothetical protein
VNRPSPIEVSSSKLPVSTMSRSGAPAALPPPVLGADRGGFPAVPRWVGVVLGRVDAVLLGPALPEPVLEAVPEPVPLGLAPLDPAGGRPAAVAPPLVALGDAAVLCAAPVLVAGSVVVAAGFVAVPLARPVGLAGWALVTLPVGVGFALALPVAGGLPVAGCVDLLVVAALLGVALLVRVWVWLGVVPVALEDGVIDPVTAGDDVGDAAPFSSLRTWATQ